VKFVVASAVNNEGDQSIPALGANLRIGTLFSDRKTAAVKEDESKRVLAASKKEGHTKTSSAAQSPPVHCVSEIWRRRGDCSLRWREGGDGPVSVGMSLVFNTRF
jgi:hypothetical protein